MALVTKQSLTESIMALLAGGDPSAGKKFERRVVEAHLQQSINRKLKTEYMSATLPGDETIPEGLVLACYNDVPVTSYKGLSRAMLPAMPISLRRSMGVYFVGPAANGNTAGVSSSGASAIISIEAEIGVSVSIRGTNATVTGLTAGSTSITCAALGGREVEVFRGNIPIAGPDIAPTDGSTYYSKTLLSATIILSNAIVAGEYWKIQTR